MYKTNSRRQSVTEKEKVCKKNPKRKKKGKKCRTGSVDGVNQQVTPRSQQTRSAGNTDVTNGSRFPSLNTSETKAAVKSAKVNSSGVSPCMVSVTESQSVNTDLSESTISLLSSTGNSQTDVSNQPFIARAYSTQVDTLMQSLSVLEVKNKSPISLTDSVKVSRPNKSQQTRGSNSPRKTPAVVKNKTSSLVQNGKNSSGSSKLGEDRSAKPCKSSINTDGLRWELISEDEKVESERLRIYKINRRKRYIAAAQVKGLQWTCEYNERGSPISSCTDLPNNKDNGLDHPAPIYSTISSLAPVTVHQVRGKLIMEC